MARDAPLRVIDKGFDNGPHASACERYGIITCVPGQHTVNNGGDGTLFDRAAFTDEAASDSFVCPAGRRLVRKQLNRRERAAIDASPDCAGRALKPRCPRPHDASSPATWTRAPSRAWMCAPPHR